MSKCLGRVVMVGHSRGEARIPSSFMDTQRHLQGFEKWVKGSCIYIYIYSYTCHVRSNSHSLNSTRIAPLLVPYETLEESLLIHAPSSNVIFPWTGHRPQHPSNYWRALANQVTNKRPFHPRSSFQIRIFLKMSCLNVPKNDMQWGSEMRVSQKVYLKWSNPKPTSARPYWIHRYRLSPSEGDSVDNHGDSTTARGDCL